MVQAGPSQGFVTSCPRQVGKSYVIRKLGAEYRRSIIEITFETNPEYKAIVEGDLSTDPIYEKT